MILLLSFSLYSCAISKALYLGPNDYSQRTGSIFTDEEYSAENINSPPGQAFPDAVYIKTRTQSFNLYHYYIISGGHVFYKSIDGEKEPKEWTLLAGTGIPNKTKAIIEISADADELTALSAEGNFYRYFFDRTILYSNNTWLEKQGWPESEQIYFDPRTSKNRSWALGKRNHHVLYYEDIFGNQHHNGTMEIATTYVLLEDGQEICYGDTGLPSDFSRNFTGPQRGAFISVSLSASASTMFVINEAGEMYTRLVDFDTAGKDPMFFKYTYIPYKSDLSGTEYFSNLNEWALPSEDWRAQPRIPLSGNAAITKHITISQNGQGNSARELRVAGFNEQGETGYWSKQIFDDIWNFVTAPLYFSEDSVLVTALTFDINAQGRRGLSLDKSYSGYCWNNNEIENGWEYQIPDFNILEGSCDLIITWRSEACVLKLHPVEMWTNHKRDYQPGRTGSPKMFFLTLEIPENAFDSLSVSFAELLTEKFYDNDRKLFSYILTASSNYIIIREINNSGSFIFLTDGTIPAHYSEIHFGRYIENFNDVERYYSPELIINDNVFIFQEELNEKIKLNSQFLNELRYKIRAMKWSQLTTFKLNISYLPAHYIAKLTPLRFVDVPKIKTVTTFGNKLVLANNAYNLAVTNARIWLYENIIEMLETRILCYKDLLAALSSSSGGNEINIPLWYSGNISDYWKIAGLPNTITGDFYAPAAGNQSVKIPSALSFVPPQAEHNISGWFFIIGENPNSASGNFSIFLEPRGGVKAIYSRKGKTPLESRLRLDCALYINGTANSGHEQEVINSALKPFTRDRNGYINVRVTFDGRTFEIREYPARHSSTTIFRGSM